MVGKEVIAINTCIMNDGKPRLTIGKTYEVIDSRYWGFSDVDELCYVIINDNGDRHNFSASKIREFFKIK